MRAFIDSVWFGEAYPLILILMVGIGYLVAHVNARHAKKPWLASANNESKRRLMLVHEEADLIGDMSRVSRVMDLEVSHRINEFMIQYLRLKMKFSSGEISRNEWVGQTKMIHSAFLSFLKDAADSGLISFPQQNQLMDKFNDISKVFYRVEYSYVERTPDIIMFFLLGSSLLVAILVGFMNGMPDKRHVLVPLIFVILVSFTFEAIRDLDDPLHGTIRPSSDITLNLLKSLESGQQEQLRSAP
jgi:hypothetical protein